MKHFKPNKKSYVNQSKATIFFPECESANPKFSDLNFSHSQDKKDENMHCYHYRFVEGKNHSSGKCTKDDFDTSAPRVHCKDFVYDDSKFAHPIVSDFNVAPCVDEKWPAGALFTRVQMPELVFWVGMMLGNTFFGWTADHLGGRRTIVFVSAVISVTALLIGFVENLRDYTWCTFIIGLCALSASNISQAALSEAVPSRYRKVLVATKVRKKFLVGENISADSFRY